MPDDTLPPDADECAPIDDGGLSDLIGYALRRAQLAVFEDFHRSLAALDIRTAQFGVLVMLRHNPGLKQNQVCTALGIKTTNFVPLLDGLERRGLAERRSIAGDRRARGLFLTATGAQALAAMEILVAAHEARLLARIGAAGKQQLLGLLRRLADLDAT